MNSVVVGASKAEQLASELLTHIWATGANANPLVRRLEECVEQLLLDAREDKKPIAKEEDAEEETLEQARDDGWQHALDSALELVEAELAPCDVNPAAEAPLLRIARALEHRKSWAPDEYDYAAPTPENGDEGKQRDHKSAPKQDAPRLDISAKERVLEMIPMGRSELRENVTRVLTEAHGLQPNTTAMAIGRLIGDGKPLKEIKVDKYKILERVRVT